jgi:glutathione synthase/RimK-type ligase-like ATP-grasp enzyme
VKAVLTAALESGTSCSFLDLDEFLLEGSLCFDSEAPSDTRLAVGDVVLALGQFSGIYCRLLTPAFEELHSDGARKADTLASALHIALLSFPGLVVNRPLAGWENSSKLTQLRLLTEAGFRAATSLVTTRAQDLMGLRSNIPDLIYKSASAQRSIVDLLGDTALLRIPALAYCPVLFQEAISGPDIRAHVVGDEIYCVRIESNQVDYRYAASRGGERRLTRYEHLPPELAKRCIAFAASRGLSVAGFDFKIAESGEYFCLEMNPSPAFPFFDGCLDGDISNAVVRLLASGSGPGRTAGA